MTFEIKGQDTVDVGRLKRLVGEDEILVGFPSGVTHPKTSVDNATIAEWLHDGTARIPARPFLLQGILDGKDSLNDAIRDAFALKVRGFKITAALHKIGVLAVGFVQDFVRSGYYQQHMPNAPSTILRKGSDVPLIDTGFLINSMTYVVGTP